MYIKLSLFFVAFLISTFSAFAAEFAKSKPLADKSIVCVLRAQYPVDHHNTANIFQRGEINQNSWHKLAKDGSRLLKIDFDAKGNPSQTILLELPKGIIRDVEASYDASHILFSMRKSFEDSYHIYEMDLKSRKIKQLTRLAEVSDIDPIYLPDGDIAFASTRAAKYCGCNRHIMCNLYKMSPDGANITQIGNSIEFEGTPSITRDGKILYTRWEYVDRNFSGAQGLWTCNPDGTRHALYWGQETKNPALNGIQIPNSNKVVAILSSCHDIAWGALAIIDKNIGVEGEKSVVKIFPESARKLIDKPGDKYADSMKAVKIKYEDPEPISEKFILSSRQASEKSQTMNLYLTDIESGTDVLVGKSTEGMGLFDAKLLARRTPPMTAAPQRSYDTSEKALAYVSDVYEGTHLKGVKRGDIKYLRIVENPPKLYWSGGYWENEGSQAPAMNYDDYDDKIILGTVPVESDGSAYFEVPAEKFIYLQALDANGDMLQTMRSGMSILPGEIASCAGCHESRAAPPPASLRHSLALKRKPSKIKPTPAGATGSEFSYIKNIQPILDKHCVKCHDFGGKGSEKIVLCGDRGLVFNQSYLQLHSKKAISAIGAGPDAVVEANTWGAKHSKIVRMIRNGHSGVKMPENEFAVLRAWIDLNAPYYSTEDSAYPQNPSGRSPLAFAEIQRIFELAAPEAEKIGYSKKEILEQKAPFGVWKNNVIKNRIAARLYRFEIVSFDRPEMSPIFKAIPKGTSAYSEALEIIRQGARRLDSKPRADMESFASSEDAKTKNKRAAALRRLEESARKAIENGEKFFDPQSLKDISKYLSEN